MRITHRLIIRLKLFIMALGKIGSIESEFVLDYIFS